MALKNKYFELSPKQQKRFQVKLGLYSVVIIACISFVLSLIASYLLLMIPLIITLTISLIAPFFDVPSLVAQKRLNYYSLFLLGEKERQGTIKIHAGTLFDYYFVFDKAIGSEERRKLILLEYLKGMMNIIQQEKAEISIEGTSYIINERTAKKIGLKKVQTNGVQKLILAFNYVNLMVSLFFVKKGVYFPDLSRVSTFRGQIIDIKKNEQYIKRLILKIENFTTTK
ncbi:hypothetical protein BKI52_43205 [marine bacterium AO1-C]|nr:hypothetical protein BKI52_43205 [marine bacterium AO1-C]